MVMLFLIISSIAVATHAHACTNAGVSMLLVRVFFHYVQIKLNGLLANVDLLLHFRIMRFIIKIIEDCCCCAQQAWVLFCVVPD